ncbi:ankyrin repeat domain-containing protein 10-like [Megalops cyprinoides]|uniref:ankyrin repeat domain-containing protein 10-like n=1 Tax=Megalops cyprinoides TaxID=118141 RepID=UPI001863E343|nr:ankyrin repeat domain-containing protein 10-like [Megalops cyprinoides]
MSVSVESGFSSEEVLNIRFPLHRACRDGDIGALCSLLQCIKNEADLAAEDSFYGWTPIHWAAHFGKLECMMRLVQVGSGVNAVTSKFAQTPTHIAAFGGHPECLLWLLQAGADINRQDYVGETPIHKAARAGSIECINTLLLQGAKADLRNASGLTAADLAHAQGFQECAQLLSNAQNQLNQLNDFCLNGVVNGDRPHIQVRSIFNGAPSRKRSLDCMESNHIKKARTYGPDSPMNMFGSAEGELESMHTESAEVPSSSGDPIATNLTNGHTPEETFLANGFSVNMPCHLLNVTGGENALLGEVSAQWVTAGACPTQNGLAMGFSTPASEGKDSSPRDDMCGSLHLDGSPSSCVSHRPTWASAGEAEHSDLGDTLHYGHYHGFGDTAENIDEASSQMEHSTSVKAEQRYDHAVFSTMHLYHGS